VYYYEAYFEEKFARIRESRLKYNGNAFRELKKRIGLKTGVGFTLIEVMLAVVLVGLLAGIGMPVYYSLQTRNDLDIAAAAVSQNLRRAQVLSQSVDGDRSWGVRIDPGNVIVFQGSSFASRDQSFDETFSIAENIVISGPNEIVFSKLAGLPQSTGNIMLTSSANESKTITINAKGTVSY